MHNLMLLLKFLKKIEFSEKNRGGFSTRATKPPSVRGGASARATNPPPSDLVLTHYVQGGFRRARRNPLPIQYWFYYAQGGCAARDETLPGRDETPRVCAETPPRKIVFFSRVAQITIKQKNSPVLQHFCFFVSRTVQKIKITGFVIFALLFIHHGKKPNTNKRHTNPCKIFTFRCDLYDNEPCSTSFSQKATRISLRTKMFQK